MPGEHARLSASGSKRWMECPGSLLLEDLCAEEDSEYAAEGTKAHALAESILRYKVLKCIREEDMLELWQKADIEMQRYTTEYADYCKDIFDALMLKNKDAEAFVEERVRYDEYAPDGYGTVDFVAIGGRCLHIVDLKYGKGVPVTAIGNPQPRLYALGALNEIGFLYDIDKVIMHIYQPRIQNISVETLSIKDLLAWGNTVVAPKAEKAYNGTREFSPGEHCRFCKARATCRVRAVQILSNITKILIGGTHGTNKRRKA